MSFQRPLSSTNPQAARQRAALRALPPSKRQLREERRRKGWAESRLHDDDDVADYVAVSVRPKEMLR